MNKLDRDMTQALAEIRSFKSQRSTRLLSVANEKEGFTGDALSRSKNRPEPSTSLRSRKISETGMVVRSVENRRQMKSSQLPTRELPVVPLGGADHVFQTSQHDNDQFGEASKTHIEFVNVDGHYASPECMKGVPVTKLVEGDGYWKTPWKSLQDWSAGDKRRTSKTTSFFDRYPIHPNQLAAKKYYGGIGLYTGLVPEVLRIISERLGDFNIADPVQWLRNQLAHLIFLHETSCGSAGPFSLRKSILEFRDKNSGF